MITYKKKIVIVLMAIIVILLLIIGALTYRLLTLKETAFLVDKKETQSSVILDLDNNYKEKMSSVTSNFDQGEVNLEFADKWRDVADKYYKNILNIASEDLKQALVASQKEWSIYSQNRMKEQEEYLNDIFQGGSIVPVLLSKFEYDLCRDRAIELYDMYSDLEQITRIS